MVATPTNQSFRACKVYLATLEVATNSDHVQTVPQCKQEQVLKSDHPTELGIEEGEEHRSYLQVETDEPDSAEQQREQDEPEAEHDLWSFSRSFIYCHHVQERPRLYVLRECSLPIPLKDIDAVRRTHTFLNVFQEYQIGGYWNVDGDCTLRGQWTALTHFTFLNNTSPRGYTWSVGRLTKIQAASMPEIIWP